ncbi:MAG: dihydropyrimidinase [Caldilineaceae bacterium]|nr:dihydropyrimidinase [Caldilineaceae bacterium]
MKGEGVTADLVIRGGTVITASGPILADVAIVGETIAAVGLDLAGKRQLDATGCYVIPGGVDPHVHLQLALGGRVSADSFATGTIAAACGGTTTVIDFVDPMPGESLHDALAARRAEADVEVAIDYGLHMTIPTWHAEDNGSIAEIPAVLAAGCCTFKLYQAYPRMMLDDVALLRVCQAVARTGGRVVLHSETGPLLDLLRTQAVVAGHTEPIWHERTRPARLEATAIHRAAEIAHLAGCPLHIFHVGCAEAVAEIQAATARGVRITGESCPQYLLLNADEHLGGPKGELFVCAPPLRTREDQAVLWRALADGTLAMVSTDHCPWLEGEKRQADFTLIPGGVPSIEARLALIYSDGVCGGHLSLSQWVQLCCTQPAQLMGLQRKGQIAPGFDADIVIFDPQRLKTLSPATLHEHAGWTPYDGHAVTGWPRTVLLRGEVIVLDEQYVGSSNGRFVARGWVA